MKKESNVTPEEQAPVTVETPVEQTPVAGPTNPAAGLIAKIGLVPIVAAIVVVALLVVGTITKTATSSPKAVFKSNINKAYKEVSDALDDAKKLKKDFDLEKNALYVTGDVKVDTNIKELEEELGSLKGLSLSFEGGLDLSNEELLAGASIKGDKKSIGGTVYYKDDTAYVKTSFLDDIIKTEMDDLGFDFEDFKEEYDEIKDNIKVDYDSYDYIAKKFKNALIKSLDSKSMEKTKGTFEVDGKTVKATKVSYVFDKAATKELINKLTEQLLEDDDFLKKVAESTGLEKADVKEAIKEVKETVKDIDFKGEIKLNVYVKGITNKAVGFSVEYKEKEYFSVFQDGKKTEAIFDTHVKSDEYGAMKVVVLAEEKKKETEVTVKYNKQTVASLTIRKMDKEEIDLDYKISYGEQSIKGTIYFTAKQKKNNISGEYKVKVAKDDEYIELSGSYGIETKDSLDGFSTSGAKEVDELDEDEVLEKLKEAVEDDDKLNALFKNTIEEAEESSHNYNYIGMEELYDLDDVKAILKKSKPMVLYVGDTYYSSYYDGDKYDLLQNLKNAQSEYNFHSYYYDSYYAGTSFNDAIGEATPKCISKETTEENEEEKATTKCDSHPTIYFLKDGKVQVALRGTVTTSDIESALKQIGLI